MAKEKEKPALTGENAKPGVGLHRKPTCVEIIIAHTGLPFIKVNQVVKTMTPAEKAIVEKQETGKVAAAFQAANVRLLEKNKATESVT